VLLQVYVALPLRLLTHCPMGGKRVKPIKEPPQVEPEYRRERAPEEGTVGLPVTQVDCV